MRSLVKRLLFGIFSICLLTLSAACSGSGDDVADDIPDTPAPPVPSPVAKKTHGIVFYMMGSGTGLESDMDENVRKVMETAPSVVSDSCKIAIFYDRGNYTRLTEVKKVGGRTKQVVLKEWNPSSTSSVDKQFMSGVLKLIRDSLGTDTYGLVMSSHGGGWVPSDIFDEYLTDNNTTRFFGEDGNDYMEVPQLAEALTAAGAWDYLLFDACFMSSVEALYDLRHVADYIIASPSEVMGAGFPYQKILPLLFTADHNLTGVCQAYMDSYKYNAKTASATIALVKTAGLDMLASVMKTVMSASTVKADVSKLQGYEGFLPHLYFDLKQYVHAIAPYDVASFDKALDDVVVYSDHTPTIYTGYGPLAGSISMTESCGITCYVETNDYPNTHSAYLNTAWAKAVGAK